MIVVAGDPAGLAASIALAIGEAGSGVELVGRVRDDAEGDAIVLALARAGVGHAALLRDPATTPRAIEPADLELALRYITSFGVLVLAAPDRADLGSSAAAAAQFAGAHLVLLVAANADAPDGLTPESTVIAVPPADPDGAFARLVAVYAVALDAGLEPETAWAAATAGSGAAQLID